MEITYTICQLLPRNVCLFMHIQLTYGPTHTVCISRLPERLIELQWRILLEEKGSRNVLLSRKLAGYMFFSSFVGFIVQLNTNREFSSMKNSRHTSRSTSNWSTCSVSSTLNVTPSSFFSFLLSCVQVKYWSMKWDLSAPPKFWLSNWLLMPL